MNELPESLRERLAEAGIDDPATASDAEILAVPNVGPKTLEEIRAATPASDDDSSGGVVEGEGSTSEPSPAPTEAQGASDGAELDPVEAGLDPGQPDAMHPGRACTVLRPRWNGRRKVYRCEDCGREWPRG